MDQNCQLAAFHLSQNSKFWSIFQTLCFSYCRLPLVKVSARCKGPKSHKNGTFHGYWINTKNFGNFQCHNHICYTDETYHIYIYLDKVVHLVKSWVVSHRVCKVLSNSWNEQKNQTFSTIFEPSLILQKAVAYLMHHLAYHHWSKM